VRTLLAALAALLLGAACSVAILTPSWQDSSGGKLDSIPLSARPGGTAAASIKFVPADNESNGLDVSFGGDQAAWVSADPRHLTPIVPLKPVPFAVRVAVPANAAPGSYRVEMRLRSGEKDVARINVNITVQ
jgi:hypothetical protein